MVIEALIQPNVNFLSNHRFKTTLSWVNYILFL